jgi:hypothetical protein
MRLKIGTAFLVLALAAPAGAEVQIPRQPQSRAQPPPPPKPPPSPKTIPAPKTAKCSLAACINQGVSQGYGHKAALNWCQANNNGC